MQDILKTYPMFIYRIGPKLVRKHHSTPAHLKRLKSVDWDEMFLAPSSNKHGGKNGTSSPKSPLMMRRASFGKPLY